MTGAVVVQSEPSALVFGGPLLPPTGSQNPKMPQKSIYRQPGARTYQLVHRSQRDPLIHDPDAPQHVLKEFERENVRKVGAALSILTTKPNNKRLVFLLGKVPRRLRERPFTR